MKNSSQLLYFEKSRIVFLLYILAAMWSFTSFSQKKKTDLIFGKQLTFYQLNTDNGLSNNMVRVVEQDESGFIWVGTADGINKYDGSEFLVFRKENSSLADNYLQNIHLSKNGNLLIANDGGFDIYNPYLNQIEKFKPKNVVASAGMGSFSEISNDEILISDYGNGMHLFKNDKQIKFYEHNPDNLNSLSSNRIEVLTPIVDSIIWVGTNDKGLNKFNYNSNKIIRVPILGKSEFRINDLFVDSHKNLWIGTNEGLKVITSKGDTLQLKKQNNQKGLSGNDVIAFEEDNFGNIWLGTYDGGLNILDPKKLFSNSPDFKVEWFLPKEDGSSVFNETVSSIKKDFNGNMWLGTYAGINYVNPRGEPVKIIRNTLTGSQHVTHNRVMTLDESEGGTIWLGTDGGGIDRYHPETDEYEYALLNEKNGLKSNHIFTVLEDGNTYLWIGTYLGGLNKYNLKTKKWDYYLQGNQSDGNDVRVIYKSKKEHLWAGTNRGGLFRYIPADDRFEYQEVLGKIDIRDISEAQDGTLWLATYGNGIIHYNPFLKEYKSYSSYNLKKLTSNVVFAITVLTDGQVVAGTKHGGLVQFMPGKNTVINITEADGLSNNTINSLIRYDDDTIWLGTFNGISKYNTNTHLIENLNRFNNIQKSEYNPGAALKTKSSELYFGSNKGLNKFNPKNLIDQTVQESIIFKDLLIFNESVPVTPNNKKGILHKSLFYTEKLNLPADKTVFSIEFTSLNYPVNSNTQYSYILEGFNDYWIDLKKSNRINFSNIPPGDYTLKVKAQNQNATPIYKELKISILPPFWKTLPAYLFYIVTLFIFIWAGLKYYSDRIKLRNSLLFEKKQRQLEHDLNEERIRFYTGFSHELKTPLTLILAPLEDLLETIVHKQQRKNLKLIKRNADNLLRFINKLLEFRKSEEGLSKLELNQYNLSKKLTIWIAAYDPILKKKGIELIITKPQNPVQVYCDIEKIQIIVNNLLSNAIKYSPQSGKIHITLSHKNRLVELSVEDSGIGINSNDLNHIFEWYYQSRATIKKDGSGIGLALSKRFAELHKGTLSATSKAGKGSCFTLTIPYDDSLLDSYLENNKNALQNKKVIEDRIIDTAGLSSTISKKNLLIQPESNRKLILLIDDNPDVLEFLESTLAEDYDLLQAEDGEDGILQACKYVPDLIVSDVMMPGKTGIDLCQFIKSKKETSHIPIILLSAKNNFEMIETGYGEGADDYMVKPFNVHVLKARIKNLIESRTQLLKLFSDMGNDLNYSNEDYKKLVDVEKQFLKEFHEAVYKNMLQGIKTVEVVAEEIGMSRSSLFRKIKAITGLSINEYIRNIKVERAAYLIKNEKFTVSQAAYEVGFGDAKYFRKIFKEKYGKTPSEFKPN